VAVADGLILTSAADAHVLGLGPLAATPRPGIGTAVSSPPWTLPARHRAAVIRTDRAALPRKVRVRRNVFRYCTTKSSSSSSSSVPAHRCARDRPSARRRRYRLGIEGRKTRSLACRASVLLVVTAMSGCTTRGNADA
jgi:hypothetical protein